MNVKFAILSTIAVISLVSSALPASAQVRERNSRFVFAPNTWKQEEARVPAGYGEPVANPHSVTHGSMPKGSSLLGIDPTMLVRRPAPGPRMAPIAQANLMGKPSFTNVVPMLNPFAPVANKGQFGNPLSAPPVVASLPPQAAKPQTAQPKSLAPASANSNLSGKINPRHSTNNLSGRMAKPARALVAKSGTPIQSYGNSSLYTPGSTVPTGSGFSTHTSVTGVLYRSTQKH